VTYDDAEPGLLSKICGVVHAMGAEVLAAHVYTLHVTSSLGGEHPPGRAIVLDRLSLAYRNRALPESRCLRLAAALREVIANGKSIEDVIHERARETASRVVPERVGARNDLSDEHTVVSVVCDNTSGLLYAVTRTLAESGLDIHTAKITTWGGRAEDAFYVTKRRSELVSTKLTDDEIRPMLEDLRGRLVPATCQKYLRLRIHAALSLEADSMLSYLFGGGDA
jgi:[protein-PII] uridylyltransferase